MHKGGFTLTSNSTGNKVILNAPSIEFIERLDPSLTALQTRTLDAMVISNGATVGRLPLGNLGISQLSPTTKNGTFKVDNIPVTLTKEGADALNFLFSLPGPSGGQFFEGFQFGTLSINGQSISGICPQGQKFKQGTGQCQ